jgi:hypothetical protein
MENDELVFKIQRLYASISAVTETDMSKFRPKISRDEKSMGIYQDWSGNLSEAERMNYLHLLVSNIASLEYYLNKWADQNGRDKSIVHNKFKNTKALQIIHDLWNTEKHANSNIKSKSGLFPVLKETNSYMKLATKAKKGSSVGFTFNANGTPKVLGDGLAEGVISGDVMSKEGKSIGDFHKIALDVVAAWESVLRDFNIYIE